MIRLLRHFCLILTVLAAPLCASFAGPAIAQAVASAPDYTLWERVANRAEEATRIAEASNTALEVLREELVDWRDRFRSTQSTNAARISTIERQIETLGPSPAEGETEAEDIAARRQILNDQLAEARAPVLQAEEAFTRASGLIAEIDTIIRTRETQQLMELGPSPANPLIWPDALSDLGGSLGAIHSEVSEALASPPRREQALRSAPVALALALLGFVALFRGAGLLRLLFSELDPHLTSRWSVLSFGARSLLELAMPVAGGLVLVQSIKLSGLTGSAAGPWLEGLPLFIVTLIGARWLAARLFPAKESAGGLFALSNARRAEARLDVAGLGLTIAFGVLLRDVAVAQSFSEKTRAVLNLPIAGLTSILLFRVAQILNQGAQDVSDEDRNAAFIALVRLLTRATFVVSGVSIALALIGYTEASWYLVRGATLSLAIFGLIAVLQRFSSYAYGRVMSQDGQAGDALFPVITGGVLVLLSLPVLALIWGARWSTLSEMWTRFSNGLSIGNTTIAPTDVLTFFVVFAAGYVITRLLQSTMRTSILPRTKMNTGGRNALLAGVGYIGIFLSAVIAITVAGIDLSSIAIVAGALSVGIGFGLQTVASNFVSGIILLIERPVAEGDWIEVGGVMGTVRDISVRSTRIETFDRTDVIVPNADLISNMVTNWTRTNMNGRAIIKVGVAYGTDTKKVEQLLREIADNHSVILSHPEPQILFTGFGADSLDFEVRAILSDVTKILNVISDLNHAIARRFAEEGIEIPFAQRDVWLRNPEALKSGADSVQQPQRSAAASSLMSPEDFDSNGPVDAND